MKKKIFYNFYKDVSLFFILCSLTLTLIVWILQAVNFLDIVSEDGHSLLTYFKFSALNIPKILSKLMLLTYFLSLFYVLGSYEEKNQLIIYWTNGISKFHFMKNILTFSIVFFIFYLFLSFLIVPYTQDKARSFIRSSNLDFFPSLIKPKKFVDTVENLTIFLNEKKNNSLKNIIIKDSNNSNQTQIIISKGGEIIDQNNQTSINLNDGIIINYGKNQNLTSFNFKETNFNLNNFKTKTTTSPKIQEIDSKTLLNCLLHLSFNQNYYGGINKLTCEKSLHKKIIQESYKRIFLPIYIPLLSITVLFIVLKSSNNKNYKRYKLQIFIYGIIIIIMSQISINLISLNFIRNLSTLLFPIITILYLFFLFKLKMKKSS